MVDGEKNGGALIGGIIDADLVRLELVNGERVLPIGLRSFLATLSAVNFSSIHAF